MAGVSVPVSILFPWRKACTSDIDLFHAVAQKTGEDSHEIRHRGFVLTGPDDTSQLPDQPQEVIEVRPSPAISDATLTHFQPAQFTNQPSPRLATASQVKAIRTICNRRTICLVGMLRERFGLTMADELGIR